MHFPTSYFISWLLLTSLTASAKEELTCEFKDLPIHCLEKIASHLDSQQCASLACVNKTLQRVISLDIDKNPEAVKLSNEKWMLVQQAIRENRVPDIIYISNPTHFSFLRSSRELRNRLIQNVTERSSCILHCSPLTISGKQEARNKLNFYYEDFGLLAALPAAASSANRIAELVISIELWDQVWFQVNRQVWDRIETQVGVQIGRPCWLQVRRQIRQHIDVTTKTAVWDQYWAQVKPQIWKKPGFDIWEQMGLQFKDQVKEQTRKQFEKDIDRNFDLSLAFSNSRLEEELQDLIDHVFLVVQLSAFTMLHSPEIDKIRSELSLRFEEVLGFDRIDEILNEIEIPNSTDMRVESFLKLLRKALQRLEPVALSS